MLKLFVVLFHHENLDVVFVALVSYTVQYQYHHVQLMD